MTKPSPGRSKASEKRNLTGFWAFCRASLTLWVSFAGHHEQVDQTVQQVTPQTSQTAK